MCKKIEPVECPVVDVKPKIKPFPGGLFKFEANRLTQDGRRMVFSRFIIAKNERQAIRHWNRWARKEARKLKGATR